MKAKVIVFFMFWASCILAQTKVTVSGTITDKTSKETLLGVNVYVPELKLGTTTNEYGFYSLTIPSGSCTLVVSYVGYTDIKETINITRNTKFDFALQESATQLTEVVVVENTMKTNVKSTEMSVAKIPIATLKKMPVILGEVDVLKSITTLPGVTNAGEAQSGFNVRGGAADQNLVLLDEAVVYNTSHLFGFFSVFNADILKDFKLYKGGIPARYGGRVASVLDIYQKDGSNDEYKFNGGIGILSSRFMAEGPIVADKGSFAIAGRGSYAHLFLKLSDNENSAYFYDLNTKFNYKVDANNTLYFSGYFGRDVFSLNKNFINTYGNTVFNARWNHLFSDKLFSNLSLIYSDYYYGLELDFVGFKWASSIKNFNLKYDFKHYLFNNTKLFYGINAIYHHFNPGKIEPSNATSGINTYELQQKYAFEPAFYIEAEQKVSDKIQVNYGLRYSLFYRLGNENINLYQNDQAVVYNPTFGIYEAGEVIGEKSYTKNQVIANFNNLEPRFSLAYTLSNTSSIKMSYNRMAQYLHLISNTQSPTPLDVWTPSDTYLKPQILNQVAVGYFRAIGNRYGIEVETFYKTIKNRVDYIDGADLIANEDIEQAILNGKARAYGLEVLVKKNEGKLTGYVAYTLSKSEQQTEGRTPEEPGINKGMWYSTAWDKTHNLSVTGLYQPSKKWNFSAIFTLQSGQPVTYPNGQYQYQSITIPTYGNRNDNRLPAYHRIDFSATYVPRKNESRKYKTEWVFGVYNLYNRKNAAAISFRQNADTGQNEALRLSIFGIVPSVSYNFKF